MRIGRLLAERGVLGRFAVDFLTARRHGRWQAYAIELNLRKAGTTHPFLTLQFLTNGHYDAERNLFLTPHGDREYLVASDHVESPGFRLLERRDLYDIMVRHRLHFDNGRQKGIVLHMLASLGECGRVGLTAVEDDPQAAEALYERTLAILSEEARAASVPSGE